MKTDPIKGKTLRWTFQDGPVAGKTFEHTFGFDGTVTWHTVGSEKGKASKEFKFESARISDDVHAISYLSSSGYTLTTVLDFRSGSVVSFASNERTLTMQHGSLVAIERAA